MAKTAKKREIVAYDSSTKKLYKLADNVLSEITVKERASSAYNITYMPGDNVKYVSVEVPNGSEEDEISIITNKTYELLELDIEKEYKISYSISNASIGINTVYNVFVVENEKIESEFKEVANKLQYIDYIDIEPLMYQNYYTSKIIEGDGVQVFIYFHKTYATLTVYKDGELINYKILSKLSIDMLHSSFSHDLGERIPEHMFLNELSKYGFDHIDDAKRVSLNKILGDAFKFLTSNLAIILKTAQLDKATISKVFVGTDIGLSQNFLKKVEVLFANFKNINDDEILEMLLNNKVVVGINSLEVTEFVNIHKIKYDLFKNIRNFTVEVNSPSEFTSTPEKEGGELRINPFVLLSFLRANEQLKLPNDVFNISMFLRPPPFAKRYSGKLILSILAIVILASIYPVYNYVIGQLLEIETKEITEKIPPRQNEYERIDNEINSLQAQLNDLRDRTNEAERTLSFRYELLNNIHDKKVNYLSKANASVKLANILNSSHIKVTNITFNDKVISLRLKGTTSGVTAFLKEIGADDTYTIESRDVLIKFLNSEDKEKEYESNIVIRILK